MYTTTRWSHTHAFELMVTRRAHAGTAFGVADAPVTRVSQELTIRTALGPAAVAAGLSVLWIASGLLAFTMVAAGGTKLAVPRVKLLGRMRLAETWSDGRFKLLGLAELARRNRRDRPACYRHLAGPHSCCRYLPVVLMAGAVKTHVDLKESPAAPAILALPGVFVALGRRGVL